MFPNPTSGTVNLEFLQSMSEGVFEVCNILGEKIMEKEFSGSSLYKFDLSSQPDGMYFIQIKIGESVGAQRIIKH